MAAANGRSSIEQAPQAKQWPLQVCVDTSGSELSAGFAVGNLTRRQQLKPGLCRLHSLALAIKNKGLAAGQEQQVCVCARM